MEESVVHFCKILPVQIIQHDREAKLLHLQLAITSIYKSGSYNLLHPSNTSGLLNTDEDISKKTLRYFSSASSDKFDKFNAVSNFKTSSLKFELTDDQDLFFLYFLTIGEEEFSMLKRSLHLNCEFNKFHEEIVALFEEVLRNENQRLLITFELKGNDGLLRIVENNQFRQLIHLELAFHVANDTAVKEYLASELKKLKQRHTKLDHQFKISEDTLSRKLEKSETELRIVSEKLNDVSQQYEKQITNMKMQYNNEISSLRERNMSNQQDSIERFEKERKQQEDGYVQRINTLQNRVDELTIQHNVLLTKKIELETMNKDYFSRITTLQQEVARNSDELTNLRNDNKRLDTLKFEHEKMLERLNTKITMLEQGQKDKEQIYSNQNQLLETTKEQKQVIEENNKSLRNTVEALEAKYDDAIEEIHKGNSIIQKLQDEIKSLKHKAKLKKQIIKQQDGVVKQYMLEREKLEHAVEMANQQTEQKESEIQRIKKVVQEKVDEIQNINQKCMSLETQVQLLTTKLTETKKNTFMPSISGLGTTRYTNGLSSNVNYLSSTTTAASTLPSAGLNNNLQASLGLNNMPSTSASTTISNTASASLPSSVLTSSQQQGKIAFDTSIRREYL